MVIERRYPGSWLNNEAYDIYLNTKDTEKTKVLFKHFKSLNNFKI